MGAGFDKDVVITKNICVYNKEQDCEKNVLLFRISFYKMKQNTKDGTRRSVTVLCVIVWYVAILETIKY